jgi:hypothetical protein
VVALKSEVEVRFRARVYARVVGSFSFVLGIFLVLGVLSQPDLDAGSRAIVFVAALPFAYLGYWMVFGFVVARPGTIEVRQGVRRRQFTGDSVLALEICDAKLFIAGQRTVGIRLADGIHPIAVLARYPTARGLLTLEEQLGKLRAGLNV